MKVFLTTLLAIATAAVLILGNLNWAKKTTISSNTEVSKAAETKKDQLTNGGSDNKSTSSASREVLLKLASNWPKESIEVFTKSLDEKRPFKILIVGSSALGGSSSTGWPALVETKVNEAYGETVSVDVKEYALTSLDFIEQDKTQELVESKADLIIFEPFTLNDNGIVRIEDSLDNITTVIEEVNSDNPNAAFVLQPPYPLYNAQFYPLQVEALKNYAETNQISYLDHWTAWPDPATEEIKDYLLEDQSAPNEKGHGVWAEFVEGFLISK